jgi:hypothetical protein
VVILTPGVWPASENTRLGYMVDLYPLDLSIVEWWNHHQLYLSTSSLLYDSMLHSTDYILTLKCILTSCWVFTVSC